MSTLNNSNSNKNKGNDRVLDLTRKLKVCKDHRYLNKHHLKLPHLS